MQKWIPLPKETWWRTPSRPGQKVSPSGHWVSSRLAEAYIRIAVEPAGISTPPMTVSRVAIRNMPCAGAHRRSASSTTAAV
ncbi:hypothetical protein D3C83_143660 [compost metagenome]